MRHKSFDDMQCPIARSLERVGEWWSMLILRDALLGLARFDEFQESLGIAPNILTRRLKALVEAGLLERRRYSERPPRDEYILTRAGQDFRPVERSRPSALVKRARIRLVGRTDDPPQADVLRRMAALPRADDPPRSNARAVQCDRAARSGRSRGPGAAYCRDTPAPDNARRKDLPAFRSCRAHPSRNRGEHQSRDREGGRIPAGSDRTVRGNPQQPPEEIRSKHRDGHVQ